MSAYVVSKAHIDYLVNAAVVVGIRHQSPMFFDRERAASYGNGTAIGRALWAENHASVAYRYPDCADGGLPGPIGLDDETIAAYTYATPRRAFNPVVAIKAVGCYQYQSCEHPEWGESAAKAFTDDLLWRLIEELPGYDEAPWGIE